MGYKAAFYGHGTIKTIGSCFLRTSTQGIGFIGCGKLFEAIPPARYQRRSDPVEHSFYQWALLRNIPESFELLTMTRMRHRLVASADHIVTALTIKGQVGLFPLGINLIGF